MTQIPLCSTRLWSALVSVAGLTRLGAQSVIPIRPLGPIVATTSAELLGNVASVRALRSGGVLVNDWDKRRVLLLDSTLMHVVSVADTTSETSKAYGDFAPTLLPFTADSSVLTDLQASAFIVIDPAGKIARIMAMPALPPRGILGGMSLGNAPGLAFDHAGHALFREPPPIWGQLLPAGFVGDTVLAGPDSVAILRLSLSTRVLDTVAELHGARLRQVQSRQPPPCGGNGHPVKGPIPWGDDWTVLDDGTVAVVRAHDYHVDWIGPDGGLTATGKIQHEWTHITDSLKAAILDSTRRVDSTMNARTRAFAATQPLTPSRAGGAGCPPRVRIEADGSMDASDLPDYWPPFSPGTARSDADGNIWVRMSSRDSVSGGPVFEVINRQGVLVDRVQIPGGTQLVGLGHGVAYLTSRVGNTVQLARARIR